MRSFTSSATLLLGATAIYCSDTVLSSPIGSASAHPPIFVNDIKQCPALKAKEKARDIHDLYVLFVPLASAVSTLSSDLIPLLSGVPMISQ
jgi:hypothetical protein